LNDADPSYSEYTSAKKGFIVNYLKRFSLFSPLVAAALLATSLVAEANPDIVKKDIEKKFPDIKVDKVTKTNFGGLYEIYTNNEILYTDEKTTFLVLGNIVDTQTKTNVSEARLAKLNVIKFDELPFDQAIKLVRGNGSRRMAIFEDPNCGYCKRFEQDLNTIDNITAYIFPYPILTPDSAEKSKAIWCAPDKLKAWQDAMLRGTLPTNKGTCENPIEKNVALGQKFRINGIPVTFFEDGERVAGAVPKANIEAKLAANEKPNAKVSAK
jgi:thiol:disulfide interchange protein DsbC